MESWSGRGPITIAEGLLSPPIKSEEKFETQNGSGKNILPLKSSKTYIKFWNQFRETMGLVEDEAPSEEVYLHYLEDLRDVKHYKGNTIMTLFSRLNACHKYLYGKI